MILLTTYLLAAGVALFCILTLVYAGTGLQRVLGLGLGLCAVGAILSSALLPVLVYDHEDYLGDLWTAFDAATKSAQGLASSTDYFSPIGPVYDWMFRAATALRPLGATSVPLASALFAICTVLGALGMLCGRVPVLVLGAVVLIAVTTILSPRDMEDLIAQSKANWLAPYNRWAWGLMVPVTLALCARQQPRGLWAAGITGVAIAVLLLLKITYGAAALGLLGVCVVLGLRRTAEAGLVVLGCAVGLLGAHLATGQALPYLADLQAVATLDSNGLRPIKLIQQSGEMFFWAGLGMAVLWLGRSLAETTPAAPLWRSAVLLVTVAAMSNAILMQNHYITETALYLLLPLIAADHSGMLSAVGTTARQNGRSGVALVLMLCLPLPLLDMGHLGAQYVQGLRFAQDPSRDAVPRRDMIVHQRWLDKNCDTPTCHDYQRMRVGAEALRALGATRPGAGSVLAFNFSNPFPFLLGIGSPPHAPIWLHANRSFSEQMHIPAARLFEGVDFVAYAPGPNGNLMRQIYAQTLAQDFEILRTLPEWVIYGRRN